MVCNLRQLCGDLDDRALVGVVDDLGDLLDYFIPEDLGGFWEAVSFIAAGEF